MINLLKNIGTALVVACAVVVAMAVARREFLPRGPVPEEPREVEDWTSLASAGHRFGAKAGPVVIVEFSDFQCPFCKIAANNLRQVSSRYGDRVTVVFRHFPLTSIHPYALEAAIAAECAAAQDRFEAFHDLLFEQQENIGSKSWAAFAEDAGVPSATRFAACLDEDWSAARVREDSRAARQLRLGGTPSVIINGLLLPGTPSLETLEMYVERALKEERDDSLAPY